MSENLLYKPYKQTSFSWSSDSVLNVFCPWLSLDIEVEPDKQSALNNLIQRLGSEPKYYTTDDAQEFFRFFASFPIMHVEPRADVDLSIAPYISEAEDLLASRDPIEFLNRINKFDDIDPFQAFDYFPSDWEWSTERILNASRISGTDLFDPYSVYTVLRQQRLQFQIEGASKAQELLKKLEALRSSNESLFFEIMAIILEQQYYVTNKCCDCLNPAMETHQLIRDQIQAYMNEELNHDNLIMKSIQSISDNPIESFDFAPEVKLEIEVIKYAAKTCALGFSVLVSIMEGTVYPDSDPVGDILKASSKPQSHIGVESHFQINRSNNHTAIPETFVAKIPPVTEQTVLIATRLAEVTIRLDTGLATTMLSYLNRRLNQEPSLSQMSL